MTSLELRLKHVWVKSLKITIPIAALLLGPASFSSDASPHPTLYGKWLIHEMRPSPDHWITREFLRFYKNASGEDRVDGITECKMEGEKLTAVVTSRILIHKRDFSI